MIPTRVYEIFVPELGTFVKFKVLSPETCENFLSEDEDYNRETFMKKVLEHVVFNMKTEIVESLKMMSREAGSTTIEALYNGCVMLNPALDIENWVQLAYSGVQSPRGGSSISSVEDMPFGSPEEIFNPMPRKTQKKVTKAKFLNLDKFLKERVIGQNPAIEEVVHALKRSQTGLNDEQRPLGVFLFAGSSGVGKTKLAKELHSYLFGDEYDIVRIDCGELQHKHENQRLIGSPQGYIGHDEGGFLTNQVERHPQTVVLLDEVEKAHEDIWNTFLRIFDEGIITNNKGEQVSFRETIIILTTNLGNKKIVDSLTGKGVGFGTRTEMLYNTSVLPSRALVERVTMESIKESFRPEFLNRIDKVVVFNHLSKSDFEKIAELELQLVENKLAKKGNLLKFDDTAIEALVAEGVDTIKGARGMAQIRRDKIENMLADLILQERCPRGTIFELSHPKDKFEVNIRRPSKNKATAVKGDY